MAEESREHLIALLADYEGKKLAAFVMELAHLLSERDRSKYQPMPEGDPGSPSPGSPSPGSPSPGSPSPGSPSPGGPSPSGAERHRRSSREGRPPSKAQVSNEWNWNNKSD